jgi:cobalt/nickel transport system permease protein
MDIIDRYAYSNRLRLVDPIFKVSLAALTLVLCLALSSAAVGVLAVIWMFCLAVLVARIPARIFVGVLLAESLFMALTTVGVALSVTLGDPTGLAEWVWKAGPVWISSSHERVRLAITLVARALGCASAMNFLSITTPLVDLIDAGRRLRAPSVLIDLMTIIYRYIFVLFESLGRMRTAQEGRLGYCNFRRGMSSAALLATRLFIETYQRSQRLQIALESRGYVNELRVLPLTYRRDWRLVLYGVGIVTSLMLVWRVA